MTERQEPPSGRQLELAWGDQQAVVTEVGGGLRTYTVSGRAVLDGYGAGDMCSGGRGQLLAPWPNRLAGGRYRFGDEDHQLPLDEPERGNAIHGLVRWANWEVLEHEADRAVVGLVLHPRPGYPFFLGLSTEYRLAAGGLSVTTTATNLAHRPLPFGMGFHPYLTVGTDTVDDAVLHVPSGSTLEADGGIPTGAELEAAGTGFDFRAPRPIGNLHLDTCFSTLGADEDGRRRVELASPDRSVSVTVWMDASFAYVMVFTGDTLAPARRRRGLAVEPMTCAPDAFTNGLGLRVLRPGETATATWGIEPDGR